MADSPAKASIDLVCWDFGDTLVHERFMRICPPGVPEWEQVYDRYFVEHPEFEAQWMVGDAVINEMIPWLATETGMTPAAVSRHLRHVWTRIEWFESSRHWIERLDGRLLQAVVTVNPFEFSGISTGCGLDPLVDVIVTSADLGREEKSVMAIEARRLLGLEPGLGSSLLIDNKQHNVDEFRAAGGHAIFFDTSNPDALHAEITRYVE